MVNALRKESTRGFEETIVHLEKTMNDEGFFHLLTKRLHEIFKKKLGVENYPKYAFVLGCKPELAKMALDVSKDAGMLYPCSFVVYEDAGKVMIGHASIMKIAPEVDLAPADKMAPVIEETGKQVHKIWDKL